LFESRFTEATGSKVAKLLRPLCTYRPTAVGGVAQWLGRRSLAGGLYLIYAWSMVDM